MNETMKHRMKTFDMVCIAIFAVLMAICSWISIPTTVPFTLQTFGLFLTMRVLGGKNGTFAVLIYILLGAIGLPVFAGFSGGIGVLFGTTGGYILGFLLAGLVMWAMEKIFGRGRKTAIFSMIAGMIVYFAFGTFWFMAVYTRTVGAVSIGAVLGWCVIPFIVPDVLKMILALLLGERIGKILEKESR